MTHEIGGSMKLNERDVQHIIATHYYNTGVNLMIPNVYWGLNFNHELDLLVLSTSNYGTEIEIKTSVADCKKDIEKAHKHYDKRLKYLYFAVPSEIYEKCLDFIPENAGILVIHSINEEHKTRFVVDEKRKPVKNKSAVAFTSSEVLKIKTLLSMRYWSLLRSITIKKFKK